MHVCIMASMQMFTVYTRYMCMHCIQDTCVQDVYICTHCIQETCVQDDKYVHIVFKIIGLFCKRSILNTLCTFVCCTHVHMYTLYSRYVCAR